jgi:hypothetical protein
MGMLFESRCPRSVARAGLVAVEANLINWLSQLRVVVRAVHVVAIEAGYAAAIHHALHKIITLHAVFVRRAVCKMREALFAEFVIFELPEIREILTYMVADGPVVITSFHRIR